MSPAKIAAFIVLVAALGFMPLPAFAQAGETDVGEVAGLGGVMLGAGAQPSVTGSAGHAFSRYGMFVFDTSFTPLGSKTIQSWPDRSTVDRSHLLDFGLDFHVRVPIGERCAPYGIAGVGLLWNFIRQNTFDSHGLPVVNHFNQINGALHTGGGFRYYVRSNWGLRQEVKVIVSKQIYTQVMMGIFYVTPSNWP